MIRIIKIKYVTCSLVRLIYVTFKYFRYYDVIQISLSPPAMQGCHLGGKTASFLAFISLLIRRVRPEGHTDAWVALQCHKRICVPKGCTRFLFSLTSKKLIPRQHIDSGLAQLTLPSLGILPTMFFKGYWVLITTQVASPL